jgi:hypothetical protein
MTEALPISNDAVIEKLRAAARGETSAIANLDVGTRWSCTDGHFSARTPNLAQQPEATMGIEPMYRALQALA